MDELTNMLFPEAAPFILLAVSVTSILTLVVLANRLLGVRHDIREERKEKHHISRRKRERLEDVCRYIGHLAKLTAGHLVLFFMVILRIILDRWNIECLNFDRSIAIFLAVLVVYWIVIFLFYYTDWLRRFKRRDWKFRLKRKVRRKE